MKATLTYIGLIVTTLVFSQNTEDSFPNAIKKHIKEYNKQSDLAFKENETVKAQVLFDSLVSNYLIGTQFQDYTLKSFEKKKTKLSKFKKPVFILTYASWCVPSKGEFQALNKLAQKFSKDVKFVILFWDKKHSIKKIAQKFNHNITICYAHETYKNDALIVSHLKHTLGFPTSYFLDENLKVVNIKRGGAQPNRKSSFVQAYTMNYNAFRDGLGSLLIGKNIKDEQLTTN
ncbi:redoxin domain-containing protein [Flavobacterium amnicola]|uniref:Redoxin domain-containing protein n=1 Tax=Flavobacterium amnicola TaxID=2506422 RepID=A0A4Q1K742_9FLAO|nr:redoxin domain-containing protein [Flavobacterium amnicola]RXR20379.1 redoxin domain-containing protein [Flavobacterium amnicola]